MPPRLADVSADLDALYRAPFAEFVSRRNSLATRLKGELGAEAAVPAPDLTQIVNAQHPADGPIGRRSVYFPAPHGRIDVAIWRRDGLRPGQEIDGPAIIEEFSSTTVLLPGDRARVGKLGEIVIRCGE